MLVGYVRVSTSDLDPALQLDALEQTGCDRVYTETASGAQRDRPELKAALDYMRSGGKLVFQIFGALAEFERSIIQERTRAHPWLHRRATAGLAFFHDRSIPVKEIARRLGISVSGLYRHFPGGRGAVLENENDRA